MTVGCDYNRIVVINPIKSLLVSLNLIRRFLDSDDVKVVVDSEVKRNLRNNFRKFWYFVTSSLLGEKQEETFFTDLLKDLHYLEFSADRMPFFNHIIIDFGSILLTPSGIPTVGNPKWTENFYDDNQEIILARLIFGESRNRPQEEKIAVAWVVKNLLLTKINDFGFSYHEIILKNDGVIYQFSPINPQETDNFPLLIDPLKDRNDVNMVAWEDSYEIARDVILEDIKDPTGGAVFFHSKDLPKDEFIRQVPRAMYIKEIGLFNFYGLRK